MGASNVDRLSSLFMNLAIVSVAAYNDQKRLDELARSHVRTPRPMRPDYRIGALRRKITASALCGGEITSRDTDFEGARRMSMTDRTTWIGCEACKAELLLREFAPKKRKK